MSDHTVRPSLPDALAPRAFWVLAPRFLAGAYPGAADPAEHARKLDALVQLGVTRVISLMEENETDGDGQPFRPYAAELQSRGVTVERFPIADVSTPSVAIVTEILDAIDGALQHDEVVYVHCWGGRGRTGVIVGCWLVRHRLVDAAAAGGELRRLRANCVDAHLPSPDTPSQVARIRTWNHHAERISSNRRPGLPSHDPELEAVPPEPDGAATFTCAACGATAAIVMCLRPGQAPGPWSPDAPPGIGGLFQNEARLVIQLVPAPCTFSHLSEARMQEAVAALRQADAAALYRVNPEYAPFWCPRCERSYCANHWTVTYVFDGPFFDCVRGVCAGGHERQLRD